VLEPEAGIVGIGSGGNYALAAAGEVISGSVGYAPMVGFAAIVAYGITMFAAFLARFYDRKGWGYFFLPGIKALQHLAALGG
jgi:hypothetical protein